VNCELGNMDNLLMFELKRHIMFPTLYRLIKLAILLPVETATVERTFSTMKIIKIELRNKMVGLMI
jgi:hypothetical protein